MNIKKVGLILPVIATLAYNIGSFFLFPDIGGVYFSPSEEDRFTIGPFFISIIFLAISGAVLMGAVLFKKGEKYGKK